MFHFNQKFSYIDCLFQQRLNVLLTRAKSLMIIIGNLEKLNGFESWRPFITHCVRSGLARKGPLTDDSTLMEKIKLLRIHESDKEASSDDDSDDEV